MRVPLVFNKKLLGLAGPASHKLQVVTSSAYGAVVPGTAGHRVLSSDPGQPGKQRHHLQLRKPRVHLDELLQQRTLVHRLRDDGLLWLEHTGRQHPDYRDIVPDQRVLVRAQRLDDVLLARAVRDVGRDLHHDNAEPHDVAARRVSARDARDRCAGQWCDRREHQRRAVVERHRGDELHRQVRDHESSGTGRDRTGQRILLAGRNGGIDAVLLADRGHQHRRLHAGAGLVVHDTGRRVAARDARRRFACQRCHRREHERLAVVERHRGDELRRQVRHGQSPRAGGDRSRERVVHAGRNGGVNPVLLADRRQQHRRRHDGAGLVLHHAGGRLGARDHDPAAAPEDHPRPDRIPQRAGERQRDPDVSVVCRHEREHGESDRRRDVEQLHHAGALELDQLLGARVERARHR